MKAQTGSRGIALLFHQSVLEEGGWSTPHTPAALPLKKDPALNVQEAVWNPGPVWTCVENLAHTGIRSLYCPTCSQSLCRLRCPSGETSTNLAQRRALSTAIRCLEILQFGKMVTILGHNCKQKKLFFPPSATT
jgi:hypothetical protein